jgi:hypothetical protein
MNCTICNKPILLIPSAEERARKYGGKRQDYINLFTTHAVCAVKKRSADTVTHIRKTKS